MHEVSRAIISKNEDIILEPQFNPMVNEEQAKYEVVKYLEVEDTVYTLIIRDLRRIDAGNYSCYVGNEDVPVSQYPRKTGQVIVVCK